MKFNIGHIIRCNVMHIKQTSHSSILISKGIKGHMKWELKMQKTEITIN